MLTRYCALFIASLLSITSIGFAQTTPQQTPTQATTPTQQQTRPTPQQKPQQPPKPLTKEEQLQKLRAELDVTNRPSMITQAAALAFLSLMPFLLMMLSSFVKIVVVLSLLRNALGVQQAPPNQVINGVALLLSIYIMFPTGMRIYDATKTVSQNKEIPKELFSAESAQYVIEMAKAGREPLREFLLNNSLVKHHKIFFSSVYRMLPDEYKDTLKPDDFIVLVPSFMTTQLKSAFEIGVLIYIPFFVIDLVVSNILLAMGMMMLSPVTISMPLKLFLLVMMDGWTLLIQGLVVTFK